MGCLYLCININTPSLVIFRDNDMTVLMLQYLDIYHHKSTAKLQPDTDEAFGGNYLLSALKVS